LSKQRRSLGRQEGNLFDLFGYPVGLDRYLLREVERANQPSRLIVENEIAAARAVLCNLDHCQPLLPTELILCLRFELAKRLHYLGHYNKGMAEYEAAFAFLDSIPHAVAVGYAFAIAERLASYYSFGRLDEALVYSQHDVVRELLRDYGKLSEQGQQAAVRVICLTTRTLNLTQGSHRALDFINDQIASLGQVGQVATLDRIALNLDRWGVILTGDNREECRRAAALLVHLLHLFLNNPKRGDRFLTAGGAASIVTPIEWLGKALCYDRDLLDSERLALLRGLALNYEVELCSLPPSRGAKIWNYGWLCTQLASAIGVFVAFTDPAWSSGAIASGKWSGPMHSRFLPTLPVHRRLDALQQQIVARSNVGLDVSADVKRFAETVLEWRGAVAALPLRSVLRRNLARQIEQVLAIMRKQALGNRAETTPHAGLLLAWQDLQREFFHSSDSHFVRAWRLAADRQTHGHGRTAMDEAVNKLAARMTKVVGGMLSLPALISQLTNRDVLFVCSDPALLMLPWEMLSVQESRLIALTRSFTVTPSLSVAALLTDCVALRSAMAEPLDMAAYCAPAPRDNPSGLPFLDWQKLINKDAWKRSPEGFEPLQGVLGGRLDVAGDLGSPQADLDALLRYPQTGECRILLVAGHGSPKEGLYLVDGGAWAPHREQHQQWTLQRTECAILPACRLGEMFLEQGEITGFDAGLLLQNVPRVLSCRWLAYDVPLCRQIPRIVKEVASMRHTGDQACWARSVRNVIVEGINRSDGLYDLANLMLIGVP